jgi:hypothetical protein
LRCLLSVVSLWKSVVRAEILVFNKSVCIGKKERKTTRTNLQKNS